ncbi:MAG TPA: hypothetical protein VH309_08075 [Elusimicrobiota bacterium]|jgi:hypothetical protein|nr:hypothetical protein [Elusimicrobiota bacterium]
MKGIALLAALLAASSPASAAKPWRFAVSGDSRNCGDVVVPAIAAGAKKEGAKFYWHLGDLRATYTFDQDMLAERGGHLTISAYLKDEWNDFIENQILPFGRLPFFLGIGNHETIPPKTREQYLLQFADWLDSPVLRAQRLADDPEDHRIKAYYHWKQGGVDFVTLDNATEDQFDGAQVAWLEKVLERDRSDAAARGVVVGMHRALPNSYSCGHSMNESAQGVASGRRAYRDLLKWTRETGKPVAVVASHSHFVMNDLYDTPYWNDKSAGDRGVLPGWIVGTAGAIRYPLPGSLPPGIFAKTGVYGYLLAEVAPDGKASFQFKEVTRADVPAAVVAKFGGKLVDECFSGNKESGPLPPLPASCSDR